MGVEVAQMTPQIQSQYDLPVSTGVFIDSCGLELTCRCHAGLVSGDVITSFGPTPIATLQDLQKTRPTCRPLELRYRSPTQTEAIPAKLQAL